jgi:hypothetical protein
MGAYLDAAALRPRPVTSGPAFVARDKERLP